MIYLPLLPDQQQDQMRSVLDIFGQIHQIVGQGGSMFSHIHNDQLWTTVFVKKIKIKVWVLKTIKVLKGDSSSIFQTELVSSKYNLHTQN